MQGEASLFLVQLTGAVPATRRHTGATQRMNVYCVSVSMAQKNRVITIKAPLSKSGIWRPFWQKYALAKTLGITESSGVMQGHVYTTQVSLLFGVSFT